MLTHLPSGFSSGRFVLRAEAVYVARQLYAAAPEAWHLAEMEAVIAALPRTLSAWANAVNHASAAGVSPLLLRRYEDYRQDLEEVTASADAAGMTPRPGL